MATKISRKSLIWPPPVYCATFAGGEVYRMSVSADRRKPWDFERYRTGAAQIIGNERGRAVEPQPLSMNQWRPSAPARDLVASHIEHDGQTYPDPLFTAVPPVAAVETPKRRRSASRAVDPLDAILAAIDELSLADLEALESLISETINQKLAA